MIKRIGLIGCVAKGKDQYDGQTVSTRLWEKELGKVETKKSLIVVDTYEYKKHVIKLLLLTFKCAFSSSHIVFMLSENGLSFYLPILYFVKRVLKKHVFHRVIGGNLTSLINHNLRWVKYLNVFDVNWVQSPNIVTELQKMGITNAVFLENFREYETFKVNVETIKINKRNFCTFCRVCKEKGISLAIEAIGEIQQESNMNYLHLDIYGPIDEDYKEEFEKLLESYKQVVSYKGSIDSKKSIPILSGYYFHLFPTTWKGEGFPGTIIDCYNAGLPTIASDWAYNSEYITDGVTGFIYDWKKPEKLKEKIIDSINLSDEEYYKMRHNNLNEAKKYTPTVVMGKVGKYLNMDQ